MLLSSVTTPHCYLAIKIQNTAVLCSFQILA
nr:MAG TPA_asm: hypothetical protein [Bacteriophage sp.]DAL91848.1 MAG TPA: hypothetical protein [Caudoviricetes sp.]